MKRLGVALIGLGPGSEPHIKSLVDLRGRVDVRYAVCRQPETATSGALGVTPTANIDAALSDPAVDLVIVATPAATHLEIAYRCLAARKHTLVEKPLEVTLERAEKLVTYAEQSGKRFGVVLQHRFRPAAQRLRQAMDSGELGTVQAASVRVPWWRPQAGYYDQPGRGTLARDGGGVLLTQAIHSIDLFRSLVGVVRVEAAQALTTQVHQMETEDYVTALLRLEGGAPGSLMATTAMYPGRSESIEIIGSRGTAVLEANSLHLAFHDGTEVRVTETGGTGSGASIMDFPHDAHRALIQDFVDAVVNGREPVVSGLEALATHRLIESILAKAR